MINLISRLLTFKFVLAGLKARRNKGAHGASGPPGSRPPSLASSGPSRTKTDEEPRDGGGVPVQKGDGPGPDSPLDLAPMDWKSTVKRTLKEIKEDRVTLIAAGMAYYWFLALFPAVIALVGVLGLVDATSSTINSLESSVRDTLPAGASDIMGDAIGNADSTKESASGVAAFIGIAVALWSASAGMVALQKGLNVAYDITEERKFVKARLVAFGMMIATGLLGGVPSPIFTFGESTFFQVLGWILTVVAVVVLFSVFYYLGPNRESPHWTWVSAGGIVGALLWLIVSIGFFFYVNEFSSYGKTYGTMAGVVVLILWLFLTSLTVLVGGELNAELERQAAKKTPA
jgi:membrane protein